MAVFVLADQKGIPAGGGKFFFNLAFFIKPESRANDQLVVIGTKITQFLEKIWV